MNLQHELKMSLLKYKEMSYHKNKAYYDLMETAEKCGVSESDICKIIYSYEFLNV